MFARPNPFLPSAEREAASESAPPPPPPREEQSNLSYSLVRLRPNPKHFRPTLEQAIARQQGSHSSQPACRGVLGRWFLVYLPLLALTLVILYILLELFIKHMAMRTVREQASMLPERVENLPVAVPVARSTPSNNVKPASLSGIPRIDIPNVPPPAGANATRPPPAIATRLPPANATSLPAMNDTTGPARNQAWADASSSGKYFNPFA